MHASLFEENEEGCQIECMPWKGIPSVEKCATRYIVVECYTSVILSNGSCKSNIAGLYLSV